MMTMAAIPLDEFIDGFAKGLPRSKGGKARTRR
jgi:hypothetical protein